MSRMDDYRIPEKEEKNSKAIQTKFTFLFFSPMKQTFQIVSLLKHLQTLFLIILELKHLLLKSTAI